MKTGTIAILASCLLGQALAAPVKTNGTEPPVKADGLLQGINIADLKDALKDFSPSKRGEDKVSDVLGSLGLKKDDLDKKTLKKVEDKVEGLTNAAATPISRFADIGSLLQVLQPLLPQAGKAGDAAGVTPPKPAAPAPPKAPATKRTTDKVNTVLGNLGIDAKDLDKKTLEKVEENVKKIADQSATPISRAGGLGGLLDILKPLLEGSKEQAGGVGDAASGLTKDLPAAGAAGGAAGSAASALPVKRTVDENALKQLLESLGLDDTLDSVTQTADGLTSGAASNALKATGLTQRGLLDGVLGPLLGGDDKEGEENEGDVKKNPLEDVTGTADSLTGGLTAPLSGAAGQASGALPVNKRGLLDGLLGGGNKEDSEDKKNPVSTVTGTADSLTGGLTKPLSDLAGQAGSALPVNKRGLLDGLLGGGEQGEESSSKPATEEGPGAITIDKRQLEPVTDLLDKLLGTKTINRRQVDALSGLLGGLTGGKGNPTQGVTDAVGSLTGGLTKPLTGAAGQAEDTAGQAASGATGGLNKRTLDVLSGLLGGLTGGKDGLTGGKDGLTGGKDGLTGGKDGLTGGKDGLTGGKGNSTKGATGSLTDLTKGLTGAAGISKRQAPGLDLSALLEALGPVLGPLQGAAGGKTPEAPAVPTPTPAALPAAPKWKRQLTPPSGADAADPASGAADAAPAPADITPAPESGSPLTVIFDDLSEASSLLGEVDGAVPAEQADNLRETIDSFLSSISSFLPEGAAPGTPPVGDAAAPAAEALP